MQWKYIDQNKLKLLKLKSPKNDECIEEYMLIVKSVAEIALKVYGKETQNSIWMLLHSEVMSEVMTCNLEFFFSFQHPVQRNIDK